MMLGRSLFFLMTVQITVFSFQIDTQSAQTSHSCHAVQVWRPSLPVCTRACMHIAMQDHIYKYTRMCDVAYLVLRLYLFNICGCRPLSSYL